MKDAAEKLLLYETPLSKLEEVGKGLDSLKSDVQKMDKRLDKFDDMMDYVCFSYSSPFYLDWLRLIGC